MDPVAVLDPQQLTAGVPAGLRWSPIRGCEDQLTAMIRAAGLAAGTGLAAGGVDGGGFWEATTRTALQSLLHAAALDHCAPADLFRWVPGPGRRPRRSIHPDKHTCCSHWLGRVSAGYARGRPTNARLHLAGGFALVGRPSTSVGPSAGPAPLKKISTPSTEMVWFRTP
ncbi:hypothetical protein [Cryobacterium aureum]|uniref:hypothetical protein n=1 Tax=Cryobacterium aureum TaxID=995037 RepID=UPI000CF540CD|nr:hypothetical protein [Cryobacterium aureum]